MKPEDVLGMHCPANWQRVKAIRVFENSTDRAHQDDIQLSASQKLGVVPQAYLMAEEEQKYMLALSGTDNFKHVEAGDFVISLRSFEGGFEYSPHTGCVSPAYTVLRPKYEMAAPFWRHLFKSEVFKQMLAAFNVGIRDGKSIRYDDFGEFTLAFPALSEQRRIGDFLDRETARIDALVEKKIRFIELLREKRQALITYAVTKGLDPSVKMKDSGVEWLGEVPENWNVTPLKYIGSAIIGLTYSPEDVVDEGEGTLVLRSSNIQDGRITLDDNVYVSAKIPENLKTRIGDILICSRNGSRSLIGKNGLIDSTSEGLTFGAFTTVFRTTHHKFLYYVLNSSLFKFQAGRFLTTTINQLTTETLKSFEIPLPPCEEQRLITAHLDRQTARLDTLIQRTERSIALLKERRAALIAAAVTGQIDLREAA